MSAVAEETTASFSASYARIYDALYADKPYAAEVELVLAAARRHLRRGNLDNVVDLACGTGCHLREFLRRGLTVHANDISPQMVARAGEKVSGVGSYSLSVQPMQTLAAAPAPGRQFDLATAFYTAMGYLVDPAELELFLRNLRRLVRPGGLVFVDAWNGAKMATQFSPHRERSVEHDGLVIHRVSRVKHLAAKNALEVHFTFDVLEQATGQTEHFDEVHEVRYHSAPEITNLFLAHGFRVVEAKPFFDSAALLEDSWNFYVLAELEEGK